MLDAILEQVVRTSLAAEFRPRSCHFFWSTVFSHIDGRDKTALRSSLGSMYMLVSVVTSSTRFASWRRMPSIARLTPSVTTSYCFRVQFFRRRRGYGFPASACRTTARSVPISIAALSIRSCAPRAYSISGTCHRRSVKLMQVIAKRTAKRFGIRYDWVRLVSDSAQYTDRWGRTRRTAAGVSRLLSTVI